MATTLAFGPFRLETGTAILFLGAEPIPLGRRAVTLLAMLLEQAGAPVSKDALIARAWPGQAVEESNLTVQVAAIRRSIAAAADAVVPRVAGMKDILAAAKKPVEVMSLDALAVPEPGATLTVLATAKPSGGERRAVVFDGADPVGAASQMVGALRSAGVL